MVQLGVKRLCVLQSAICLLLTIGFYISIGRQAAYSALLGSLIVLVASQYLAWRLFKYSGAAAAKRIIKTFYRAEAVKLVFVALMFALVFIFVDILAPVFFLSFIVTQATHWLASYLFNGN